MTHESFLGVFTQPTLGNQLFTLLVAAMPGLVGGMWRYFLYRQRVAEEKEKNRRFDAERAARHDTHQHRGTGKHDNSRSDSGDVRRDRLP